MFVTFEGLDGSGKTTQAELLRAHLVESGREVVATREPGGTELGERIRPLLLDGPEMSAWAEAALFAAARAELVDRVILPALDSGADVICDRYLDSSLAYQGIARGLGVDEVLELNQRVLRGVMPDRTFLLLVDAEESERRIGATTDRIEGAGRDFRRRVDEAFRVIAERFPDRIRALDGTLPPREIARSVREDLQIHV
jgi:dTMP kinase